jgi:primary-amine oxidase
MFRKLSFGGRLRIPKQRHFLLVVLCWALLCIQLSSEGQAYPLDPLTADELISVRDILASSGQFSGETSFGWIQLDEPPKRIVQDYHEGSVYPRLADVTAIDFQKRKAFRVIVDIKASRILSLTDLKTLQPGLIPRDTGLATTIVNDDPQIRIALTNRGLHIPGRISDSIPLQFFPFGSDPGLAQPGARLVRVLFSSDQNSVNENSPFLDGMMAVIDLYSKRVIKLLDAPEAPIVNVPHDVFDPKVRAPETATEPKTMARSNDKHITIEGHTVSWKNWGFRLGFNLREGLVLYQVAFDDKGRKRPVLYRASVSEVLTSYDDPSQLWSWMEIFDEGSIGLGYSSTGVRPGYEVPADAVTIGTLVPDPGEPRFHDVLEDRIYLYERDAGTAMYYQQGPRTISVQSTELVVGFFASLNNYTYAFNWVFRQDGSINFEVTLEGQILTKLVPSKVCETCEKIKDASGAEDKNLTVQQTGDEAYGTLVYPNVVGVNHQHWFNLRLDFDIDGESNSAMETSASRMDGASAERSLAVSHILLRRASDTKRHVMDEMARALTIFNPASAGQSGRLAGYSVVPMENAATAYSQAQEAGTVGFSFHHFWVTPYRDGELYAAGAYPTQATKEYKDTLYYYANEDLIQNRDIVVWYSLGFTHVPRPEDYPLMSSMKLSVTLQPDGFFQRNPQLERESKDAR